MKVSLCFLALIAAVSAAPNPVANAEANPLIEKRCAAGSARNSWCVSACGYNCRVQYNPCRSSYGPGGCREAYERMLSYCTTCCNSPSNDCSSCQNCGNYYPQPMPAYP